MFLPDNLLSTDKFNKFFIVCSNITFSLETFMQQNCFAKIIISKTLKMSIICFLFVSKKKKKN